MITKKREQKILAAGFNAGRFTEQAAVIHYLKARIKDLKQCGEDDSCNDLWHFADGILEDIMGDEHHG
jgi:hypothetical protein